jgi:hypothetical protein
LVATIRRLESCRVVQIERTTEHANDGPARLDQLPKIISEKVGDDLRVVTANPQVCPTFSEISLGNHSKRQRL